VNARRCLPGFVVLAAAAAALAQPAGDAPGAREAVKAFKQARARDEPAAGLAEAIAKLSAVRDVEAARAIRDYLTHDAPEVRIATAAGLGRLPFRDSVSALQNAIPRNDGKPDVLKAILAALGDIQAADAAESMAKLVPGDDDAVAAEAVKALGKICHPKTIDALVRLLDASVKPVIGTGPGADKQKRLQAFQAPIRDALQGVTGQKLDAPAEWKAWWGRMRVQIVPPGPDGPCAPIPGAQYGSSGTMGATTDRPAPKHPDINLKVRGFVPTQAADQRLEIIDIDGPTDDKAPRLQTLFVDERKPVFTSLWDIGLFDGGLAKGVSPNGPHLFGFRTMPGEILQCAWSGYDIDPRVLYADHDSLVLKYTSEDNIVMGYTAHYFGIAVEPTLLAAYQKADAAGRRSMPCVRYKMPVGRSRGTEFLFSIRDTGTCMDVRARKDWWPKGF
jgi:hypothetical protein